MIRRFELHRDEDVSGVSGEGVVAEGVILSSGKAVIEWLTEWPTSVVWHDRGLESVEHVHGHNGRTRIVWADDADLEARLADASHRAITATEEARVAKGLLAKLLEAKVIEPPYFLDGDWCVVDGSDACRMAIVADAGAALLDTIAKGATS
jgi:hypothetical protein